MRLCPDGFTRAVNIAADSYYKYDVSVTDWEGLNNGELPGTNNGNPEKPYIVVESNSPVSVMNSNWNDNWMTFANGTLAPDPEIHNTANFYQREAGSAVTF